MFKIWVFGLFINNSIFFNYLRKICYMNYFDKIFNFVFLRRKFLVKLVKKLIGISN